MSDLQDIKKDVKAIMRNHLPHIQKTLARHDERLKLILWILGVIGTIIIVDFFK